MDKKKHLISSLYMFKALAQNQLKTYSSALYQAAQENKILGLFILSKEGLNISFSGEPKSVLSFKKNVQDIFKLKKNEIFYKDLFSNFSPFLDLKIKIKDEIVGLYRKDIFPKSINQTTNASSQKLEETFASHLSPEDWHKKLKDPKTRETRVLLDVRNEYEVEVGKFKNAHHLPIEEFNEFPYALKELHYEKNKEFMIYCTGGIRCEKAAFVMNEQGFEKVLQLKGGILNYLPLYPYDEFEGECFVFDHRVAVDQNLKPSLIYHICPHCGNPGKVSILCLQCKEKGWICEKCYLKAEVYRTCSKNCVHHFTQGHKTTRLHKESFKNRKNLD